MRSGIRSNLLVAFLLVLALPMLNSGLALWGSAAVRSSAKSLVSEIFPLLESIATISLRLREMAAGFEQATLYEDAERLQAALATREQLRTQFAAALQLSPDPELEAIAGEVDAFAARSAAVADAVLSGQKLEAALGAAQTSGQGAVELEARLQTLHAALSGRSQAEVGGVEATALRTLTLTGIALVLALGAAIGVALVMSSRLTDRLGRVITRLREIGEGEGDLTARLPEEGDDEIAELARCFNSFAEKLHALMSDVAAVVRGETDALRGASQRISQAARQEQDASSNISASLEQMGLSAQGVQVRAGGLADALERTISVLRGTDQSIAGLLGNADSLSGRAADAAGAIHQLTASIGSIAASLDGLREVASETEGVLVQLDASASDAHRLAEETKAHAESSLSAASEGAASVAETIAGMNEIRDAFVEIQGVVADVAASSDAIDEVVGVIEDIADNSRLLALNALIIAAQAGQYGRAFSVVAHEMDGLANRCGESVKEIARRISGARQGTQRTVAVVEASANRVRLGVERSEHAGLALRQIQQRANASSDRMKELAQMTHAQTASVQSVKDAIRRVSQAVELISRAREEQLLASRGMGQAAQEVNALAAQVRESSELQRRASAAVAKEVGGLEDLVSETASAGEEQAAMAKTVGATLEVFRSVASEANEASREMHRVVGLLSDRAGKLEERLSGFSL